MSILPPNEAAAAIQRLGRTLTPDLVAATSRLFEPMQPQPGGIECRVDQAYGSHPRHPIDVFRSPGQGAAPILLFAGGGSMMIEQTRPGSRLRGNVGLWAARNGLLGAVMTFRLAPENQWPAGTQDVASAVLWMRRNAARFGGDPERLFVMGHSAGAGHVAGFVAEGGGDACAGAILVSGIYDITSLPGGPNKAYFGDDPERYPERVAVPGLVKSHVPLLIAVSEYDPPQFEAQAAELRSAVPAARFVRLTGHNHVSIVQHIGAFESALTAEILEFTRTARS